MRHLIIFSLVLAGCASTQGRSEAPPAQGQRAHGMRNCPSAVAGATTNLTNTPDGVDLQITASDPTVQQQVIELANIQAHMGKPNRSETEHTGMHGGPGDVGYCPIIHTATTVTFTQITGGAVIHVRAAVPADVPRLQAMVADRVARLATR
jgi:hypothetical protein